MVFEKMQRAQFSPPSVVPRNMKKRQTEFHSQRFQIGPVRNDKPRLRLIEVPFSKGCCESIEAVGFPCHKNRPALLPMRFGKQNFDLHSQRVPQLGKSGPNRFSCKLRASPRGLNRHAKPPPSHLLLKRLYICALIKQETRHAGHHTRTVPANHADYGETLHSTPFLISFSLWFSGLPE